MAKDSSLPLKALLDHMRGMETRLIKRIDVVDEKLSRRIDRAHADIGRLAGRLDRAEANLSRQIDAIDRRLDAIELENLPKRVKRIETHLGLASV